jgi:hypothetical protein
LGVGFVLLVEVLLLGAVFLVGVVFVLLRVVLVLSKGVLLLVCPLFI